jgi:hypothetical protein
MSTTTRWTKLAAWMRGDGDERRIPWRMFWVGFIVRVLYMTLAHTYKFRTFQEHFEFGWEMGRIARALATGRGFANPFNGNSGPTAWTPPLYPLMLGAIFKLFGVYSLKSSWIILTLNSIFSAATAPAIYEISWRCFGRTPGKDPDGPKIALWSGWLWALYPAAMQYAVRWVWDMALTAFLYSWTLVLALRVRHIGDAPHDPATRTLRPATLWALFGILWGLIALSNSSLLTFLPACGLWMVWDILRTRRGLASALRNVVLSAVCFIAVVSPWVIRNWVIFHAFIPMRANFGAEMYESTLFSNKGFPWMATLPLADTDPEFKRYERLGEVAYSKQQGDRAKAAIHAHPDLFLRNALHRVYFFWVSVPHPAGTTDFVEAVRRINFSFLSLSGMLGLALALRRHIPAAWLFFWAFVFFPLIYYFVTVQARFRHPLEPIICILSVYLFQSADRTRAWSWQKLKGLTE